MPPYNDRSSIIIIILFLMGPTITITDRSVDKKQIKIPGDIIIGGLFPLHESHTDPSAAEKKCGAIKADKGIQRLEAMLYAIDKINEDTELLPKVNLGVHILDTCSMDTYALEQTLEFIKASLSSTTNNAHQYICADYTYPTYSRPKPVVAVIGAASSSVSVMVANMLRLFKIPQISYSSTGAELSEKPRFEYFSRVVPPDNLQAKAMADLVETLNWTYVHAIADSGSYGEKGIENFRKFAAERGICFDGEVNKIMNSWNDKDFQIMLLQMKRTKKARGVVMFVNEDNVNKILRNLDILIATTDPELNGYFSWIASDSWGTKRSPVQGYKQLAIGAITVAPNQKIEEGFNKYFLSRNVKENTRNVWFAEYWNQTRCRVLSSETANGECFDKLNIPFKQESYVPFVIDAVNVLAYALDAYIKERCGKIPYNLCNISQESTFDGKDLQNHYRNVSFGEGQQPLIDANGDGIGNYNIFQFTHKQEYEKVGEWSAGRLSLQVDQIIDGLSENRTRQIPDSVCSLECPRGKYRGYQLDNTCCWTCIPCDIVISIIPNLTSCDQCDIGFLPNRYLNACEAMIPEVLEWTSAWAIAPACFSTFGVISTIVVIYAFIAYNKTPIIMASGRELCYFMMFGIMGCFIMTFVLVNPPSMTTCAIIRIGLGVFMCAIYAAILTKTSRLARVFTNDIRSVQRPRFITPKAQAAICSLIISVQLLGAIIWLILDPPKTIIIYPERTQAVLSCKATATGLLISLGYNMFLIIACTVYAFKTRKIPENFNETKYIGFTMYATCIIWLAFVPIYFATRQHFNIQTTSLCVCIALSGTVALWCFFAPKVYIVFFQPEKNVRKPHSTAMKSLTEQHMRFISHLAIHQPLLMAHTDDTTDSRNQINADSLQASASLQAENTQYTAHSWSTPTPKSSAVEPVYDHLNLRDHRISCSRSDVIPSSTTEDVVSINEIGKSPERNNPTEKTPFFEMDEISPAKSSSVLSPLIQDDTSENITSSLLDIQPKPQNSTSKNSVSPEITESPRRRLSKETWVVSDARAEVELILSEIATQSGTFV